MKNKVFKYTVYIFTLFTILLLLTLIVFLYNQSLPFFLKNNFLKFIFGRVWNATEVSGSFGIFNILLDFFFIWAKLFLKKVSWDRTGPAAQPARPRHRPRAAPHGRVGLLPESGMLPPLPWPCPSTSRAQPPPI